MLPISNGVIVRLLYFLVSILAGWFFMSLSKPLGNFLSIGIGIIIFTIALAFFNKELRVWINTIIKIFR
ncbi:MAG: hypothetical protein HZB67_02030 [Candidatus Aenigmarchaeota archaeon]|nr:hypothetical protein [Candidatus Aenigmarchaeota archaeon]